MLRFWVNGQVQMVEQAQTKIDLIDFLRDTLKLTGTKRGCQERACGSCTVLIDDEAKRSCHVTLGELNDKRITTIEGLAKNGKLDPLQEAFIECNAIQCGFCTPGMIMASKALINKNPNLTDKDIIKGLNLNLCRCGTYPRVIKAVQRAATVLRGENLPPFMTEETESKGSIIGKSVQRIDVLDKVTGNTKFVADYYFDNMLHGQVVWSSYPHAEIVSIDTKRAEEIPGVRLVITAKDIPGKNIFGVLDKDQPVLAEGKVRFIGEAVAVVFAEDIETAQLGAAAVDVVYKELPGVFSIEAALAPDAPKIHEKGNINKVVKLKRGDIEAAFAQADVVIDEKFTTPAQEHAWMETEGTVAVPGEQGKITVYAPNQGPFDDRDQLAYILGMEEEDVRIIHLPAGGAFGGKTELTSHAFVAIAALKTGRSARIVLSRKDSLRSHPKRHPYEMRYRIAANNDGKILGMDIQILSDAGAYMSWSRRVLEQSVAFGTGPYYLPNLNVDATCVYTNNLVSGAMRGFGATQTHFAAESAMDILSNKLNIDPIKLRQINALEIGLPAATGQILTAGVGIKLTLEAIEKAVYEELLPLKKNGNNVGIGIASGWRSVAGGLGPTERAGAALELLENGKLKLKVACTEMGQGSHTSLCQIVEDIIGVNVADIEVVAGDTENAPYGSDVSASRGTYLWGHATIGASNKMRELLIEESAALLGVSIDSLTIQEGIFVDKQTLKRKLSLEELASSCKKTLTIEENIVLPKTYPMLEDANESQTVDPKEFKTHHTMSYCTLAVAVSVDEKTGDVKVLDFIFAADGGKIINPEAARTQIEGGIIMGMGYGLVEEFVIKQGVNVADTLGKCCVPRISMTPDRIKIIFVDAQDTAGPLGSKGVGEIGIFAIAPALTNAINDAIGVRVTKLPAKKYLSEALKKR